MAALSRIQHSFSAHVGDHDAIVPVDLFNAVQSQLDDNRVKRSGQKTRAASSPLTGKIHAADGQPMSVSFSYGRGKKMYRYYVSDCLLRRTANSPKNRTGQRLSAVRVERAITVSLGNLATTQNDVDIFEAIQKVTVMGERLFGELDVALLVDDDQLGTTRLLDRAELIDPDAQIEDGVLRLSIAFPADRRVELRHRLIELWQMGIQGCSSHRLFAPPDSVSTRSQLRRWSRPGTSK